jgi:hypothetical protein
MDAGYWMLDTGSGNIGASRLFGFISSIEYETGEDFRQELLVSIEKEPGLACSC